MYKKKREISCGGCGKEYKKSDISKMKCISNELNNFLCMNCGHVLNISCGNDFDND